ncbi:hypothetical protein [Lacibacter sp.]|uniref:hypothetical protein n=1 Tax=Lacibacter sp. TaxID=1915409 RepID=UPI002B4AD1FF|nr:hypothetical protein [Lacibacter sp.]HLP38075.1 hypothetical protein [Lacibacter sp.]
MSTLSPTHRQYKQILSGNPSKKELWEIIHDFMHVYSAEGVKEELWLLTVGTLSGDHMEQVKDGIRRHNRLFFYEHSILFIDAVNQLYRQHEKKKKKRKSKS